MGPMATTHPDNDAQFLTPSQQAAVLRVSRSIVLNLVAREGLPAVLLSGGSGRRRILRFNPREVSEWLRGRRARQVRATLDGSRYQHREVPS